MKKLLILSFFFLITVSFTRNKNTVEAKYNHKIKATFNSNNQSIEYYRKEINHAFTLLKKQKKDIDLELTRQEKVQILSIAFPEMIRYDSYSDYLETSSNRILYVSEGKKASDFSTGYFQMKPSFIEDLESYVESTESLKSYNGIIILKENEKEARKERIKRMESFQWQLRYLKVFWYAAEYKYQNINFKTTQDKIRFFATAYNYGFTKPEKEITKYQTAKKFAPGKESDTEKFAFADFSIDFITSYAYFFDQ